MHTARRRSPLSVLTLAVVLAGAAAPAVASPDQQLSFPLRGKTLSIPVYRATGAERRGTIVMASGDVGWVGLAVEMAEYLSDRGYQVVGLNSRQYLGAFTSGKKTLQPADIQADYHALLEFLDAQKLVVPPVVVSGVSEGAALAVLAGSWPDNHETLAGVITMGLPGTAELGWRWTDFTSWITSKDSGEPMFMPKEFVPAVSPLPLCMIQSTKDEYVPESEYKLLAQVAKEPKKQVLIAASNHRFTDRRPDLQREVLGCLAWIEETRPKQR